MDIPFRQAKFYLPLKTNRKIDLLAIHCAEVVPAQGKAEWLMDYCTKIERTASWHLALDNVAVTRSVLDNDIAYHAPGINSRSKGYELATFQQPTPAQWADPYHQNMLTLLAWAMAGDCVQKKIDPVFVDAKGLLEFRRGITTHAEVSKAYPERAGNPPHMDPGLYFPMDALLVKIQSRIQAGNFPA